MSKKSERWILMLRSQLVDKYSKLPLNKATAWPLSSTKLFKSTSKVLLKIWQSRFLMTILARTKSSVNRPSNFLLFAFKMASTLGSTFNWTIRSLVRFTYKVPGIRLSLIWLRKNVREPNCLKTSAKDSNYSQTKNLSPHQVGTIPFRILPVQATL